MSTQAEIETSEPQAAEIPAEIPEAVRQMIAQEDPGLYEDDTLPVEIVDAAPDSSSERTETQTDTQVPPEALEPPEPESGAANATPEKTQEELLFEKFRSLGEEDRRLREERQALEAEKAKIETFRTKLAAAEADPLALLEAAGHSYETLTAHMLGVQSEQAPDTQLAKRLEKLEQTLQQQQQQAQSQAQTAAKQRYMQMVDEELKTDQYPLLGTFYTHPADIVWNLVEATYKSEGNRALSPAEAAQSLEQDLQQAIARVTQTEWFGSKFAQTQSEPAKRTAKQTKTLNNNMSAEPAAEPDLDALLFDDEALLELAKRHFHR